MPHALLYILTGAAGFAALGHWIEAHRPRADVRAQLLAGFLALAVASLGLATLLTLSPASVEAMLSAGTLVMALGILVWGLLPWVLQAVTHTGSPLVLTLLSGGWALLFLVNLLIRPGLLYSGWQPPAGIPPQVAPASAWLPVISPWWWALQAMMAASLGYSARLLVRHYHQEPAVALLLLPVPALLAFGFGWDLMVSSAAIAGPYLMVFVLLACVPYLSLQMRHTETTATEPMPTTDKATDKDTAETDEPRPYALLSAATAAREDREQDTPPLQLQARDVSYFLHPMQVPEQPAPVETETPSFRPAQESVDEERAVAPDAHPDAGLEHVRQELTDISVYTSMLLHQLGRETQDTRAAMVLCRRLRERVRDALHRAGPGPD